MGKALQKIRKSEYWMTGLCIASIGLVGFLALSCFFFLGNPGVPLGWLLGIAVAIFTYWSIVATSSALLKPGEQKAGKMALSVVFVVLRFLLLVAAVVVAALLTYICEWPYLNVWGVIGGYLPLPLASAAIGLCRKIKPSRKEGEDDGRAA